MRRAGAVSNDALAQEVADDLLRKGQGAVSAALGAFFRVAAESESTLLGPLVLLVAGTGRGVKVFDGRMRQPGLGTKRPRGFLEGEAIPQAARVGVPMSLAAAAVALAFDGSQGLGPLIRPAIARAREVGAPVRAEVLERMLSLGPKALSASMISQAFLRTAGPSAGGVITPADLRQMPQTEFGARELPAAGGVWSCPFPAESGFPLGIAARQEAAQALGPARILLTADPEGSLACACFFRPTSGIPLEGLELSVPALAVPVARGVSRVQPGAALFAPTPVAVLQALQGSYMGSVGLNDLDPIELESLASPRLRLRRDSETFAVY